MIYVYNYIHMANILFGTVNGAIVGLVIGSSLGFFNYPILGPYYPEHLRKKYDKNGAILAATAIWGGITGCVCGAIGGFDSSCKLNDAGVVGGIVGGTVGGAVGGTGAVFLSP